MHPSSKNIRPKVGSGSALSVRSRHVAGSRLNFSLATLVLCHFLPCQTVNIRDSACDNTAASEKMSCLQDQVRSTPADARTWFYLGKFYHEVGDIAKAKISYHNVVKLYPLSYLAAEAHLHQGIIHQTDGALS
jgi:tetratricopeptide (TPR) repeat protein